MDIQTVWSPQAGHNKRWWTVRFLRSSSGPPAVAVRPTVCSASGPSRKSARGRTSTPSCSAAPRYQPGWRPGMARTQLHGCLGGGSRPIPDVGTDRPSVRRAAVGGRRAGADDPDGQPWRSRPTLDSRRCGRAGHDGVLLNLQRQHPNLPVLQHDHDRPEDVDTESEDHAPDEIRYACNSRPFLPEKPREKPKNLTFVADAATGQIKSTWTINEIIKRKERARKGL
jgi:hypothetical protein